MEVEGRVTRSNIDEPHSWYIQADQIAGESGVIRSITDKFPSSDIQRD